MKEDQNLNQNIESAEPRPAAENPTTAAPEPAPKTASAPKGKKRKKKGRFRWLQITLIVLSLAVLIFSATQIILYFVESEEAREEEQQTVQAYVTEVAPEATEHPIMGSVPTPEGPVEEPMPDVPALLLNVNFPALQEHNPDVVGWLTIPALPRINHPIMWCGDDYKYLHKGLDLTYRQNGSIFLEGQNYPDFLDSHTIIYGHKMLNGSMFGTLPSFAEEEFWQQNSHYIVIHLPDQALLYEIFSVEYVRSTDDKVYTVAFYEHEEFAEMVQGMKDRSIYDTGVDVTDRDRIITLSTCAKVFQNSRFNVHAKLVWSN